MDSKLTLSRPEAAKAANVSLPTFDAWLHTPGFPAFRAGRKWLIPVEPFRKWLAEQAKVGDKDGCSF